MRNIGTVTLVLFAFAAGFASTYSCGSGGTSSAATTTTHYYSIPADAFFNPRSEVSHRSGGGVGGAYITEIIDAGLKAAVHLPHGAVVKSMTATWVDNAKGDLSIWLMRKNHATLVYTFPITEVVTTGLSGDNNLIESDSVAADPDYESVDNLNFGYFVHVYSDNWPGDSSLRIYGVVIEYEVTTP